MNSNQWPDTSKDRQAFAQAKATLPQGTISELLALAQQIKDGSK